MPTNKKGYMASYYRKHSDKWNNPTEIKKRTKRNAARAKMEKKVGKAALRGKDVDHRRGVSGGNGYGNLRVRSIKSNRGKK